MRWVAEKDLEQAGMRLFCLPHAGSGAAGYYRWKRLLPAGIAVCPVMLPGREVRYAEPSLTRAMEIVEALHAEVRGELGRPYAIWGHSMSALLAFEWARLIEREGLPGPEVLFCSGREAPHIPGKHRELHKLESEPMVRALVEKYGGDAHLLLEEPELAEMYLPILRADVTVVETYSFAAGEMLKGRVLGLAGELDTSVSEAGLARWGELTAGAFEARRFVGDHFYHLGAGQGALLSLVARELGA